MPMQVTSHQLQKSREADAKMRAAAAEEDAAAKKRLVSEDAYAALVDVRLVKPDATYDDRTCRTSSSAAH